MCFAFSNINKSGSTVASPPGMLPFDCGFSEPRLIWIHCGREVPCGLCDIPGTNSTTSISSPHVFCEVPECDQLFAVDRLPIPSIRMCRTSYYVNWSGRMFHPVQVVSIRRNSSSSAENTPCPAELFLVIVPITRPGSASSLSLHCSVSSSSSSSPSSPSSELARSLRQSLIAPSISSHVVSGSLDVNPAI